MARLDPYQLPLNGRHLIEASAGTGKTYNAVILWIRASIEQDLMPHQVLMVTFTRAATAELRERLKLRIDELLANQTQGNADPLLSHFESIGIQGERLRHTLIQRLQTLDDAAVTTLHGWAGQAIREFDRLLSFEVSDHLPHLRAQALERAWQQTEQQLGERKRWLTQALRNPQKCLASGGLGSLFNYKARQIQPAITLDQALQAFNAQLDATQNLDSSFKGGPTKANREALAQACQMRDPIAAAEVKPAKFAAEFVQLIESACQVRGVIQRMLFLNWDDQLSALKTSTRQVEADDQVLQLKQALSDPDFAQALCDRWPVALVDEFQDTDPDQLQILQRVYDDRGCVLMIGDPKQALYSFRGGDIAAYQKARSWVDPNNIHSIDQCFRMSAAMVDALNSAYQQQPDPFSGATQYQAISAGQDAGSLSRQGSVLAPLHWLAGEDKPEVLAARACADLLQSKTLKPDGKPLQPGDIALLVNSWAEGAKLRRELTQFGLGARLRVKHSRDSEGHQGFIRFVQACAAPRDSALGRALVPYRISGIAPDRWKPDPKLALEMMQRIQRSADLWEQKGAIAAARAFVFSGPDFDQLQGSDEGLACITEFLDLAEQAEARSAIDTLRWCQRPDRGAANAPIPSDDAAVVITTIHSSKGLEYPVVILPKAPNKSAGAWRVHSDGRNTHIDLAPDEAAQALSLRDAHAEGQRLLYVAVTRAKHLLLMHRDEKSLVGMEWPENCASTFTPQARPQGFSSPTQAELPPGYDGRALNDNWRIHSFSGWVAGMDLAHGSRSDHDLPGAAGEYPKGAQAGDVLHRLLDWRIQGTLTPERADPLLAGLGVEDTVATMAWIESIVTTPVLPGGLSIQEVPALPEMDFHFALGQVDGQAFDAAVQHHWSLPSRTNLPGDYLQGLMKGSLDLTLQADGRYWVLDYKSNFLGSQADYTQDAMQQQIAQHRYDVQAAVYLVALHRLLKLRLPDYDPATHLGGAIYHFVRVPTATCVWSITPQAIGELEELLCPST